MSDVFKNIADAAGSRNYQDGALPTFFLASKAASDEIQAGLGGILPSMPGMPVAKFGDLSIGIDMHPTVTPPPLPSCLCSRRQGVRPHGRPHGRHGDSMPPAADGVTGVACNILKSMAPSVKVYNQWIAQAGIGIVHLPAFVLHPAPLGQVGMSESEMWMDSSTVLADGAPCSSLTHPALSCNIVGRATISPRGKAQEGEQGPACPHFHALHHHIRRKSRACGRTAYH